MTLTELCNKFDQYEVVDTQTQIDREFYSISEKVYTDGEIKTNINKDAYIHISSVHNANYLMFIDMQHKLYLCIYKYIPETKFKEILRNKSALKKILKKYHEHEAEKTENHSADNELHVEDDLIDINTFLCTECSSEEKMKFVRSKSNPDVLLTRCEACKTEYSFVPSKYYKLSSKRLVYFKSEVSSRNIKFDEKPNTANPSCNAYACGIAKKAEETKNKTLSTTDTKK